jgi:hypothetical protein
VQTEPNAILYFYRLTILDSNLSPLLPFILILLLLLVNAAWNFWRVCALRVETPLETAIRRVKGDAFFEVKRLSRSFRQVRDRLFSLFPDGTSICLGVVLLLIVYYAWTRMDWTYETAAVGADRSSDFNYLLSMGLLTSLLFVPLATWHFVSVWQSLRGFLVELAERPILHAFERLPSKTARLGGVEWRNPEPLGSPRLKESTEQWLREHNKLSLIDKTSDSSADSGSDRNLADEISDILYELSREGRLAKKINKSHAPAEKHDSPIESDPTVLLNRKEELVALQIKAFLEHVVAHIWNLAFVTIITLVLATLLASSYPTGAGSFIKSVLMICLVVVAVAFVSAAFQMNSNTVLSLINGTKPDRTKWNLDLTAKLMLYGLGPLLALLTAEYPELREHIGTCLLMILQLYNPGAPNG